MNIIKVLSIKEPYASLIVSGVKKIETRSWKTNYRGELFIHASKTRYNKEYNDDFNNLILDMDMHYGEIFGKCRIVDCIYMDQEFIDMIKKNYIEYISGDYKIGRYAWILEDARYITPILTNGKLNIWNYDKKNVSKD